MPHRHYFPVTGANAYPPPLTKTYKLPIDQVPNVSKEQKFIGCKRGEASETDCTEGHRGRLKQVLFCSDCAFAIFALSENSHIAG